jgi:hypothetical protein
MCNCFSSTCDHSPIDDGTRKISVKIALVDNYVVQNVVLALLASAAITLSFLLMITLHVHVEPTFHDVVAILWSQLVAFRRCMAKVAFVMAACADVIGIGIAFCSTTVSLQCGAICVPIVFDWSESSDIAAWTTCVIISTYSRAINVCHFGYLFLPNVSNSGACVGWFAICVRQHVGFPRRGTNNGGVFGSFVYFYVPIGVHQISATTVPTSSTN